MEERRPVGNGLEKKKLFAGKLKRTAHLRGGVGRGNRTRDGAPVSPFGDPASTFQLQRIERVYTRFRGRSDRPLENILSCNGAVGTELARHTPLSTIKERSMSDTMAAILILPVLIALTVALECTRHGCTWLHRRTRGRRHAEDLSANPNISSAQEYQDRGMDREQTQASA